MKVSKGYCFDDLLLVPKYSSIESRKTVDLFVDFGKGIKLDIPVISANMKNVTEVKMAKSIANLGGMAIIHRFTSVENQLSMFKELNNPSKIGLSIGVGSHDYDNISKFADAGVKILCVDVAHGHHVLATKMVEYVAKTFPKILLIAGNVATSLGATSLYNAGANVIKAGVGPGSLCTTRIETGNGVPQMTALEDIYEKSLDRFEYVERQLESSKFDNLPIKRKFKIIADGGIRRAGDAVKALCFSDAVMLGSMLAGTEEAPGHIETINGIPCKAYEGSSTHKTSNIEGIKAHVPFKGPVEPIIQKFLDGIRSGCSYQGAKNLTELRKDPIFVEISNAGLAESHPHSVIVKD